VSATTTIPEFVKQRAAFDPWKRGTGDNAQAKQLASKLDQEARDNWHSDSWRRQVAADLEEVLDYGFTSQALFPGYIDVETVGEFDRPVLRERRGLKVFSTAIGGHIDESTMRDEVWEVPRDQMGFHVSELTDKLRAGFSATIADLSDKGAMRLDAEVNRRLLSLAQAAVPDTSEYYTASVGLTKAELDAMLRGVRDAIRPDGQGPVPVTIMGRAAMIDKISDFEGFTNQPIYGDAALEEIRQRGYLGTYKGANVVQLINYADEEGASYIDANELWVMGGRAGKFVLYGGTQVSFWDERTVDYTHLRARRSVGGLVHHPEQLRRLSDSSESGS
jgi:hypothetical protein